MGRDRRETEMTDEEIQAELAWIGQRFQRRQKLKGYETLVSLDELETFWAEEARADALLATLTRLLQR